VLATDVNNGPPEAVRIANEEVKFVATPKNQVIAINISTGTILWRYRKQLPDDVV
jgi:alcohol dehydrogenase (cytochrome c)